MNTKRQMISKRKKERKKARKKERMKEGKRRKKERETERKKEGKKERRKKKKYRKRDRKNGHGPFSRGKGRFKTNSVIEMSNFCRSLFQSNLSLSLSLSSTSSSSSFFSILFETFLCHVYAQCLLSKAGP